MTTLNQFLHRRGKIIVVLVAFLAVGAAGMLFFADTSESKTKPYYSGEAVSYQGEIYVGTVNTGSFELFLWQRDGLQKKTNIVPTHQKHSSFKDLKFEKEDGSLYVYLVDGKYLYKYDISNPLVPKKKIHTKDNSGGSLHGLEKVNGHLATIGSKGVKIWNDDFNIINSFHIYNEVSENISFSSSGGVIFNIRNGKIKIFDVNTRQYQEEIELGAESGGEIRKIYNDPSTSLIYVVDDESLKAFTFAGKLVREFEHTSSKGYNVIPAADGKHLYFSDGIGIVKVNKYTLEAVDWKYTTNVAENSWLMRIKAVKPNGKERIVGFNNSNLVVMNRNLEILGHRNSTERDMSPADPLFLRVDKNTAPAGTPIALRGGGFGLEEKVKIEFADETFYAYTNDKGRFFKVIEVPSVLPTRTDIEVTGEISERNYSLGFKIQ